jgi:hypothetical protein
MGERHARLPPCDEESSMKWFKCVPALVLILGLGAPEVASADRGRDRQFFQPRHELLKHRHDRFRFRDDFVRHRGSAFRHGRELRRHDARPLQVRRGHRSHSHFGLHIGVPLFWNWPPPYYAYPPPVVVAPSPPPVYIERGYDDAAPAGGQGYWYYCRGPEGYYPYVRECPGGWERVATTPPR